MTVSHSSSPGGSRDNPHGNETVELLSAMKARLYAALKHEKSCSCGDCSHGLNTVDDLVSMAESLAADLADTKRERDHYESQCYEAVDALIDQHKHAEAAEFALAAANEALRICDHWLDLNYGYLKPETDPLLVQLADATRAALGETEAG